MEKDILVMIPGPTPVVESIRAQMQRPVQAFGDPRFIADYKNLIADLGRIFNCGGKTFPLAGTGTLAMEMAVANTTKRGDSVLVVSNGFFGDRFIEICRRKGLNVDVLSAQWGQCVAPKEIEEQLKTKDYAAVTVSHVDTSTGVVAPIDEIGKIIKNFPQTVYIVDGVAASAGEFEDVDGMGIDVLFTGSQKAFGVSPGMFILWAGEKALARRKQLGDIPEYYIDFEKWLPVIDDPAKYFATPAVNMIWALAQSTAIINEEGLANRAARHRKNANAVAGALKAVKLDVLADEKYRASTLSCVVYPGGIDDAAFRKSMYDNGVVVAGALGPYASKAFRIGHMGNFTQNDMIVLLSAIERSLLACGAKIEAGAAVAAYVKAMAD